VDRRSAASSFAIMARVSDPIMPRAIWVDIAFLAGFSAFMLLLGTTLFKRTLECDCARE
jgi:hypothetical protein